MKYKEIIWSFWPTWILYFVEKKANCNPNSIDYVLTTYLVRHLLIALVFIISWDIGMINDRFYLCVILRAKPRKKNVTIYRWLSFTSVIVNKWHNVNTWRKSPCFFPFLVSMTSKKNKSKENINQHLMIPVRFHSSILIIKLTKEKKANC